VLAGSPVAPVGSGDLLKGWNLSRPVSKWRVAVGLAWIGGQALAQVITGVDYTQITTGGLVAQNVNGAIVTTSVGSSASGTGTFSPMLNLLGNTATLEGISTDGTLSGDPVNVWTMARSFSELATVAVSGSATSYYSFYADLNEPNSVDRYLSIDSLSIYARSGPTTNPSGASLTAFLGDSTAPRLVWSMDTLASDLKTVVQDRTLLVNEASSGSGTANLLFLIPASFFTAAGVTTNDYFYVHMKVGAIGTFITPAGTYDFDNAGGFEEVGIAAGLGTLTLPSLQASLVVVPEGTTGGAAVVLAGGCLFGLARFFRHRVGKCDKATGSTCTLRP